MIKELKIIRESLRKIWWGIRFFVVAVIAIPLVVFLFHSQPEAQPHYAVREGMSCVTCHVSPTGGGVRSLYGGIYGRQYLSSKFGEPGPEFTGELADRIRLGGDFRFNVGATEGSPGNSSFDIGQLNLHLHADLAQNIEFVSTTNMAAMREAYLLVSGIPGGGRLRVGRFPLSYGWLIADDTAYIRGGLGFGFANIDSGIELSFLPGDSPLFVHVSATNGNFAPAADPNQFKAVTAKAGFQWGPAVKGISYHSNLSGNNERFRVGYFDSIYILETVTVLAEADYGRDRNVTTGALNSLMAGYLEATWRVGQRTQLRSTIDYLDPSLSTASDEIYRFTIAPEFYISPLLGVGVAYRINLETPEVLNNQWQLMIRSWF